MEIQENLMKELQNLENLLELKDQEHHKDIPMIGKINVDSILSSLTSNKGLKLSSVFKNVKSPSNLSPPNSNIENFANLLKKLF